MPTFPKKKSRPWIPKKKKTWNKGAIPQSYSNANAVEFYNSRRWKSLRNYWVQMNPLCKLCEEQGYYTPAECVDHIIPIRFNGSMTSLTNLQSLCNGCHASKTGKETHMAYFEK